MHPMLRVLLLSLFVVFAWNYVQAPELPWPLHHSCERLITRCTPPGSTENCLLETVQVISEHCAEDRSKRAVGKVNIRCRDNPRSMKVYTKATDEIGDCPNDLTRVGSICRFQDPLMFRFLTRQIDEGEFSEQFFARYKMVTPTGVTVADDGATTTAAATSKNYSAAGAFRSLLGKDINGKKTDVPTLPPRFTAVDNNCPEGYVNDDGTCIDGDPNARRFLRDEITRTEFIKLASNDQFTDENCMVHRAVARKGKDRRP